jgi:hypothetical protein
MDRKKEWFTLRQVAERLKLTDTSGRVLVGNEADQAVLKLVFADCDDEGRPPLTASIRFCKACAD